MSLLFISDLHLAEERPHTTAAFLAFINTQAKDCSQLYILGDFFDAWVGDDDDRELVEDIATALRVIADGGVQLFFQHGNRDFLLGDDYAARCGMTVLPDFFVLSVEGERWLLAHGDQFCVQDVAYQQFRTLVRDARWQRDFLAKPLAERRAIAAQLRAQSQEANGMKAESIMDVTAAEVDKALVLHGCTRLIHGHTHRPARHALSLPNSTLGERVVLGEWDAGFWYAAVENGALELVYQA